MERSRSKFEGYQLSYGTELSSGISTKMNLKGEQALSTRYQLLVKTGISILSISPFSTKTGNYRKPIISDQNPKTGKVSKTQLPNIFLRYTPTLPTSLSPPPNPNDPSPTLLSFPLYLPTYQSINQQTSLSSTSHFMRRTVYQKKGGRQGQGMNERVLIRC